MSPKARKLFHGLKPLIDMIAWEDLVNIVKHYSRAAILEHKGIKAIISERGGRVIGLFMEGSPNLLWTSPSLEEAYRRYDWNLGGLRVWISPERNFYYKDPERFEGWFCPPGIDPGNYKIVEEAHSSIRVESPIEAYDYLLKKRLRGWISRRIELDQLDNLARLYVHENLLLEYEGDAALWALAQVNPGSRAPGTVIVPVKEGAKPIHYFGPIPEDRLSIEIDHISFKIDGLRVAKLGIRPEDLRREGEAIIGYLSELMNGLWCFLALRTLDAPRSQEECLDVAKADPSGPRGAIQSYNSGPEFGAGFGEIELQFPPARRISNKLISTIRYDLLALTGPRDEVIDKAEKILEVKEVKLFKG